MLKRIVLLAVVALAACADPPGAKQCPTTGIFCPEDMYCAAAQAVCLENTCGNGILDPLEECDDGNIIDGDKCSSICRREVCGNFIVDVGEACDDGNTTSGDGCSADCLSKEECGNNILDVGEACDDGNVTDGDGCSSTCKFESCGDGIVSPPEQCDDAGESADCNADCTLAVCGDFKVNASASEQCDAGPTLNADDRDCTAACQLSRCGDGLHNEHGPNRIEECDDGDQINNNGCNNSCELPRCGNGTTDQGEDCDDGNTTSGDGCSSTCKFEGCGDGLVGGAEECDGDGLGHGGETADCNADCTLARCGDAKVNATAGEQCDAGTGLNADDRDCTAACKLSVCGDGLHNSVGPNRTEQCDGDGNGNGGETADCNLNCTIARCGDNILNPTRGEQCDDGNTNPGDGCSPMCLFEGCGNGVCNPGEQCDGALDCGVVTPPPGSTCGTVGASACRYIFCGNGILEPGEECDDGNTNNGDGCSSTCKAEFCGNNITDPGEECDTGGLTATCDANCRAIICGNNRKDTGEECDDGNTITETCPYGLISCSVCDATCNIVAGATSFCGDGTPDATNGEECDNGTTGPNPNTNDPFCDYGAISCTKCGGNCRNLATVTSFCGDGITNGPETCDRPPTDPTNSGDCVPPYGGTCVKCSPTCVFGINLPTEFCGDGICQAGEGENSVNCLIDCPQCGDNIATGTEQCDGADLRDASCQMLGYGDGDLSCKSDCTYDTTGCVSDCGNGIPEAGEQCDGNSPAQLNNASCISLGYSAGTLTCTGSCTYNTSACTSVCGNNKAETGEQCDGSDLNGASCTSLGYAPGALTCSACTFNTDSCGRCGDGAVDTGEACDQGALNGKTVCDYNPTASPGATCTLCNASCTATSTPLVPRCGDGNIDGLDGESCDAGAANGNVCTPAYGIPCFYCSSSCVLTAGPAPQSCGDGTCNGPENAASCPADCAAQCGDGFITHTEQCEPPNTATCNASCQTIGASCGNGVLDAGEQCDHGAGNGVVCTPTYPGACAYCTAGTLPTGCQLAVVAAFCGDGVINGPEQCEGTTATASCPPGESGPVTCSSCQNDFSQCVPDEP